MVYIHTEAFFLKVFGIKYWFLRKNRLQIFRFKTTPRSLFIGEKPKQIGIYGGASNIK